MIRIPEPNEDGRKPRPLEGERFQQRSGAAASSSPLGLAAHFVFHAALALAGAMPRLLVPDSTLLPPLLDRPLEERGLRPREIFGVDVPSGVAHELALVPVPVESALSVRASEAAPLRGA